MPTSNVIHVPAAAKGSDYHSNLNQISSAVHHSSSSPPIKHEYENDDSDLPFGTEVVTTTKNSQGLHPTPSLAPVESPSHNTASYGALGFNQTFAYPAPPHKAARAFPGQSPHQAQPIQQIEAGQVFPGQSPPFQARNGGYFSGPNSADPALPAAAAAGTPQPQPITITHMPPGQTYATVPYPYHINYPTGQPLIQHPNGKFYPAIMNVVPSDMRGHRNEANLLSRIVDDPPNPPESALGQPKKWIRWTDMEDVVLKTAVKKYGEDEMDLISRRIFLNTRSVDQCRQRWKKALQPGLVKGKWTKEEDSLILEMVKASSVPGEDGESQMRWSEIAQHLPGRLGEHVKARWVNHLDPEIRKGVWTKTEMDLLTQAQQELGNNWVEIAKRIPGRSISSVKNRWYNARTSLKRKAEKEAEERNKDKEEILSRQACNTDDDRRSSTGSNETIQSLIFKTEESRD